MGFELCKIVPTRGVTRRPQAVIAKDGHLRLNKAAMAMAGIGESTKYVQFFFDRRSRQLGISTPDKHQDFSISIAEKKHKDQYDIGLILSSVGEQAALVAGRHPVSREENHALVLVIDLATKL